MKVGIRLLKQLKKKSNKGMYRQVSNLSNTVIIKDVKPTDALDYKYELTSNGYELNKDFSWYWRAPSIHGIGSVEFYFSDPKLATFFRIKWS